MSTNDTPKLVEVTLAKPHKHAGVRYDTAQKIKVTEPERDWLVAQQIVAAKAATTTTTEASSK